MRCEEAVRTRLSDLSVRNTKICHCSCGFDILEGTAITLRDNIVSDCRQMGFWVRDVQILRLLRNAVYDCKMGVKIHGGKSVQIEGNWFLYFKEYAFSFIDHIVCFACLF